MEIKVLWNAPTIKKYSWVCPKCKVKNQSEVGSFLNNRGEVEYNSIDFNREKCGMCGYVLSESAPLEIKGVFEEKDL